MSRDADPFDGQAYSVGVTLDLTASEDVLAGQIRQLLYREGRLAAQGLRCELKDHGQDCRDCPAATLDPAQERSRLCRLGKDQWAIEGRLEELRGARAAALRPLADEADEAMEIGALPDDLAELLTQVCP